MKVLTGDTWLFEIFDGYRNELGTAKIKPIMDAQDRWIIGIKIKDNGRWNLQIPVTNPNTNETKLLIEWLEEIDYEPKEANDNG